MEKTLEPLLAYFKGQRRPDEPFGDFCARVGFGALRDYAAGYIPAKEAAELPKVSEILIWTIMSKGSFVALCPFYKSLLGTKECSCADAISGNCEPLSILVTDNRWASRRTCLPSWRPRQKIRERAWSTCCPTPCAALPEGHGCHLHWMCVCLAAPSLFVSGSLNFDGLCFTSCEDKL